MLLRDTLKTDRMVPLILAGYMPNKSHFLTHIVFSVIIILKLIMERK